MQDREETAKWVKPYYGLLEMDDPESLGWATRQIIKEVSSEFPNEEFTFISILPMHKLDIAVRIAMSYVKS